MVQKQFQKLGKALNPWFVGGATVWPGFKLASMTLLQRSYLQQLGEMACCGEFVLGQMVARLAPCLHTSM